MQSPTSSPGEGCMYLAAPSRCSKLSGSPAAPGLFSHTCVPPWGCCAEGLETQHLLHTFHKGQDPSRESHSGLYDLGGTRSTGEAGGVQPQDRRPPSCCPPSPASWLRSAGGQPLG